MEIRWVRHDDHLRPRNLTMRFPFSWSTGPWNFPITSPNYSLHDLTPNLLLSYRRKLVKTVRVVALKYSGRHIFRSNSLNGDACECKSTLCRRALNNRNWWSHLYITISILYSPYRKYSLLRIIIVRFFYLILIASANIRDKIAWNYLFYTYSDQFDLISHAYVCTRIYYQDARWFNRIYILTGIFHRNILDND